MAACCLPAKAGEKGLGPEQSLGTRPINYADDLVILRRRGSAENTLHHLREIMRKLKLTVNDERTRSAWSRCGVRLLELHVRTNVLSDDGPSSFGSAKLRNFIVDALLVTREIGAGRKPGV